MDPRRAIADLRELDRLTGGPGGARRVAWTDEWETRALVPARAAGRAAGGGRAATRPATCGPLLEGDSEEIVAIGSHVDSVPSGGWLDGALGVFGALEVLRSLAAGGRPARTVALVDWADEEGARFGRSLLGSSAFAGTLDLEAAPRAARRGRAWRCPTPSAGHGVDFEAMGRGGGGAARAPGRLPGAAHRAGPGAGGRGPALRRRAGHLRRRALAGGASPAGPATRGPRRWTAAADAGVAAARAIVALQAVAREHGGVSTAGRADFAPGIVTAVPGRADVLVDQRHLDPGGLAAMVPGPSARCAGERRGGGLQLAIEPIWRIDPVPFHAGLVDARRRGVRRGAGGTSGGCPAGRCTMRPSWPGSARPRWSSAPPPAASATRPRRTRPRRDLEAAIAAFGAWSADVVAEGVA